MTLSNMASSHLALAVRVCLGFTSLYVMYHHPQIGLLVCLFSCLPHKDGDSMKAGPLFIAVFLVCRITPDRC